MAKGLSKTKILAGLQCPKRLYLEVYYPELKVIDAQARRRFAIGHQVGAIARQLHPGGVLIGHDQALADAIADTDALLARQGHLSLFEATFVHAHLLIRADILQRGARGLTLIEVKAATSVKDEYYPDCAVQAWVLAGSGHAPDRVRLAHVNNAFVYIKEGDYRGLLQEVDITSEVQQRVPTVARWVADCRSVLEGGLPDITVGDQCHRPYRCPYYDYCHVQTTAYPVSTLPRAGPLAQALIEEGYDDIRAIPPGRLTRALHQRIHEVVRSGSAFVDGEAGHVLRALPYPRYYLDFETIDFAVPIWLGTRPYQQLPFQWSCHIQDAPGAIRHTEFLDVSGEPPMRRFAEALVATLGTVGPVVVYNAGFEKRVMRELAQMYPDLAPGLEAMIDRVFDLLGVTRDYYYHPAMHGSWSIKAVLPTIAPDLDYRALGEVTHGGEAQDAYLECIRPDTATARRQVLEGHLRRYCALDTLAMVRIAAYFEQAVGR